MQVRVTVRAHREMVAAMVWYESRAPGLGLEFARAFDACFSSIAAFPNAASPTVGGARRAWLRRFPYSVVYVEHDERLIVVNLLHAAQDPARTDGESR